jgi:hypothetical protein
MKEKQSAESPAVDLFDSPLEAATAMGIPAEAFSGSAVWSFELTTDEEPEPPGQHLIICGASSSRDALRQAADRLAAATNATVDNVQFEDGTSEFWIDMPDSAYHRIWWHAQLATTEGIN